jgi:hypothetical protein
MGILNNLCSIYVKNSVIKRQFVICPVSKYITKGPHKLQSLIQCQDESENKCVDKMKRICVAITRNYILALVLWT